jgi:hypothetical protein
MSTTAQDENFHRYWIDEYPASPPIGFELRPRYTERWFRIHSLPLSKRYPQNDAERLEVLRRHNVVLDELLRPTDNFVLLSTGYSDESSPVLPKLLQTDPALRQESRYAFSVKTDLGAPYWHFFISDQKWQSGDLDGVLMRIASDDIADVLVVGQKQKFVYAPYDGGADIFVRDSQTRTKLRALFSSWLPTSDSGL